MRAAGSPAAPGLPLPTFVLPPCPLLPPPRRIQLASHAVERLQWSAFPALETVRLQVPGLAFA